MNLSDEIRLFVKEHERDDVHSLALRVKQYPDIDLPLAIRQITGRRIAKEKIPLWYANDLLVYPKHLSLEQCSSQQTASYKASLCSGNTLVDLTGGLGVDFFFLARNFDNSVYVEQQKELVELASYNLRLLNLNNADFINSDAVSYLASMPPVDFIYIDPARRDVIGKKTVLIEDCTPNIIEIENILESKAGIIMIKLSPMLDISLALKSLHSVSDIHIISVHNECKELLFIKNKTADDVRFHCVNILNDKIHKFSFTKEIEDTTALSYASRIGKYLYEPNTSILKAGAYKSVAKQFSVKKLNPSSHLYTSDALNTDFHGRIFEVVNICSLNKKDIKTYLSGIKHANITTRNFPISVQEIRKKTGLKEGGDSYIFATTLADDSKVLLICKKV